MARFGGLEPEKKTQEVIISGIQFRLNMFSWQTPDGNSIQFPAASIASGKYQIVQKQKKPFVLFNLHCQLQGFGVVVVEICYFSTPKTATLDR